jgi:hypothetical protein
VTREEAKEILLRHRPGTADAEDPDVSAALELARQDAELGDWLRSHELFQKSVRSSLRKVQPPAGLKEAILNQQPVKPKVVWLRPAVLLAAAASVALLLGLSVFWQTPREDATFTGFRERMARTALRDYRMDLLSTNLTEIRQYLGTRKAPADYRLTPPLERLPGYGCAVLRWRNHEVAMVCFDRGEGKLLYLFVADAGDVPAAPAVAAFQQVNRLATTSWVSGGRLYVLAAEGDEALIKGFL